METLLIFHLTGKDLTFAIMAFVTRFIMDIYWSNKRFKSKEETWKFRTWFKLNTIRYIASFVVACGLLVALPDIVKYIGEDIFQANIPWNAGFSLLIGYSPIEILYLLKTKFKNRYHKNENNDQD